MKKRKIKVGDIFVSSGGEMMVINTINGNYLDYSIVAYNGYRFSWDKFTREQIESNKLDVTEFYLGNIMDIKPMGKK